VGGIFGKTSVRSGRDGQGPVQKKKTGVAPTDRPTHLQLLQFYIFLATNSQSLKTFLVPNF
jgi:hypothetical protein